MMLPLLFGILALVGVSSREWKYNFASAGDTVSANNAGPSFSLGKREVT